LIVDRKLLVDTLEKAKKAMNLRTTLPSLKNYFIQIGNGQLNVHSSCLDWGMSLSMEGEGEVSFLAPSLLLDVVKSLTEDTVRLEADQDSWLLTVKSSKGQTVLNILPSDDYPKIPEVEGKSFKIDSTLLNELVDLGSTCAVKNPARPLWGAVNVSIQDGWMELVATDQFSLSLARNEIQSEDLSFLVNADYLREVSRLMNGEVMVTVGESMVSFSCESAKAFIRLIHGQYYDYKQVMPQKFVCSVDCDRKTLLETVMRASIVASEEDRAVRLRADEAFTLTSSSHKGRMEESIESTITGDPLEVWCQHTYLYKALKGLDCDTVTLGMSGEVSVMKISGADRGFFVVMPMSKPRGV